MTNLNGSGSNLPQYFQELLDNSRRLFPGYTPSDWERRMGRLAGRDLCDRMRHKYDCTRLPALTQLGEALLLRFEVSDNLRDLGEWIFSLEQPLEMAASLKAPTVPQRMRTLPDKI